ncbi:hypothetical protein WJS89_06265 [Sphingomicrobium sp. XHP0235]|uniref:hypothetical protein n=1 Tax=Sphingomicrobium aquimarinum TaxID=3133971 RepID=UPI0031FF1D72
MKLLPSCGAALLLSSLIACGDAGGSSTDADIDEPKAAQSEQAGADAERHADGSPFRALTVRASGDIELQRRFGPGEMSLGGGCIGGQGMAFSASDADNPTGPDVFLLSFKAKEVPSQDETGTFELEEMALWNGGTKFEYGNVPNVFEGTGKLVLTTHEGRGHNGQMRGMVHGDLVNSETGERAEVEASFHYGMGCGNRA